MSSEWEDHKIGKEHNNKEDELKEGELICDKCNGSGMGKKARTTSGDFLYQSPCKKCQGTGRVDWIENIIGKKPKNNSSSSGIFSTAGWSSATIKKPSGGCGSIISNVMKLTAEKMAKKIDDELMKALIEKTGIPYNKL